MIRVEATMPRGTGRRCSCALRVVFVSALALSVTGLSAVRAGAAEDTPELGAAPGRLSMQFHAVDVRTAHLGGNFRSHGSRQHPLHQLDEPLLHLANLVGNDLRRARRLVDVEVAVEVDFVADLAYLLVLLVAYVGVDVGVWHMRQHLALHVSLQVLGQRDVLGVTQVWVVGPLSLLQFESANSAFPASGWTRPGIGNPIGSYLSWRGVCLGFMDQANVLNRYDVQQHWWSENNLEVGSYQQPAFLCPSSPSIEPKLVVPSKTPRPALALNKALATTDYEAIMGVRPSLDATKYNASNRFSIMYRDSRTKFSHITDGSSNTIMVLESSGRPAVYRRGKQKADVWNEQGIGWSDSESAFSIAGFSSGGFPEGTSPNPI